MHIMVVELPRDQVPFVGVPDHDAHLMLAEAVANAFAMNSVDDPEQGAQLNPNLTQLAQQYAGGRHAIYISIHSEPSLEVQQPKGMLSLLKSKNRRDG